MNHPEALREFKEGMDLLQNNFPHQALLHFKRAAELDHVNPFYLSYLGLALATVEGNIPRGEDLCYDAVRKQRTQPELYLNLAEVYCLAGKREDAIETLIKGLKLTRQDARLAAALRQLGVRRSPVLSFLDRKHFLNVQLGRLRYRMVTARSKQN